MISVMGEHDQARNSDEVPEDEFVTDREHGDEEESEEAGPAGAGEGWH